MSIILTGLVIFIAGFAWCCLRAGHNTEIVYTPEQRRPDAGRAAEMAEAWPVEPRYAVTQEAQRVKAKRTRRQAERVFLAHRKTEREA